METMKIKYKILFEEMKVIYNSIETKSKVLFLINFILKNHHYKPLKSLGHTIFKNLMSGILHF